MKVYEVLQETPDAEVPREVEDWYYKVFLEIPSKTDKKVVLKEQEGKVFCKIYDYEGNESRFSDERELLGAEIITNITDKKKLLKHLKKIA